MSEMGHTGPKLALAIYAHAMLGDEGERERLQALVNGADWAANGQLVLLPGTGSKLGAQDRLTEST